MNAKMNRRKRRYAIWRMLVILVLTSLVMATDLAGALPGNPYSAEIRQVLSNGLPADFVQTVNRELVSYELPTLPPAAIVGPVALKVSAPTATSLPPPTAAPAPPTVTVIPSTIAFTSTPAPTATPMPDMANQWYFTYTSGARDTFTIEKQGDGYGVTSLISDSGPAKLLSQSWDGENLTWSYADVDGNNFTMTSLRLNFCGCGELGYLLEVSLNIVLSTGGDPQTLELALYPVAQPAPNPDYSGEWEFTRNSDAGPETFTIEKLGDVYIVTELTGTDGVERIITSQSWDGSALSWTYTVGADEITLTTLGVSLGDYLLLTGSYKGDPVEYRFDVSRKSP